LKWWVFRFSLEDTSRNVLTQCEKVEDALTFEHNPHRHILIHVLLHTLIGIASKHQFFVFVGFVMH
jgi:hypothetical protein